MKRYFLCLVMLLVSMAAVAAAPSMAGDWEYTSRVPDAVYGDPEKLVLSIRLEGSNKLCGSYMSVFRGGMKVAEGELAGTVNGDKANITYEAGWGNITGNGKARLRLRGQQLEWLVMKPGPEPDYMIRAAKLQSSRSKLEVPEKCK